MIIIIPARYNSSRFPGKPLVEIKGIPMIKRVYNQCSIGFEGKILVATDSDKIYNYCMSERIDSIMTSKHCKTGTDRVYEAALNFDVDLIINIQGDEPLFNPNDIKKFILAIDNFKNEYQVFAGYTDINDESQYYSNQIPKMIVNKKNELLYTSRSAIPGNKKSEFINSFKQVCIYAYTKKALSIFCSQDKSPIEEIEDLELLRFLENDIKVKMIKLSDSSVSVDNPEDLIAVETILNNSK